jgi:hypothetical protein
MGYLGTHCILSTLFPLKDTTFNTMQLLRQGITVALNTPDGLNATKRT